MMMMMMMMMIIIIIIIIIIHNFNVLAKHPQGHYRGSVGTYNKIYHMSATKRNHINKRIKNRNRKQPKRLNLA
jgi:ABC-type cobalt transport system substrate-binding protein